MATDIPGKKTAATLTPSIGLAPATPPISYSFSRTKRFWIVQKLMQFH